jgi:hypothetical protein
MKKTAFVLSMALLGTAAACGDDDGGGGTPDAATTPDASTTPTPDATPGGQTINVPAGDIAENRTWTTGNTYVLEGPVYFTGGTLTIQPGVTVKGRQGDAVLVITKDAKIEAAGTAAAPIVFTSNKTANQEAGDWAGLVVLGKAPINVTGGVNKIEGFPDSVGTKVEYGGTDAAHDCGTIKYVRIEYAGFELATDNEINGLTLGACGTATEVDFVQIHRGLDDGIEIFGGTVDVKHLVLTQIDDDALDWDFGWVGKAQFVIIQHGAAQGDKAIEADNNNNARDATPRSSPGVWNATIIGGGQTAVGSQAGLHLRRGTAGRIRNSIIMNWKSYAINVDSSQSAAQVTAGQLTIADSYLVPPTGGALWPTNFDVNSMTNLQDDCSGEVCFDEQAYFSDAARNNRIGQDPMLVAPTSATAPNFAPAAGSPALTGGATPPAGFDATATYFGAIGATDWTTGWTAFPE